MDFAVMLVWMASLCLTGSFFYMIGWEKKADDGVWCKAGTHFFATWKPCPCCIQSMIDEYKQKKAN